MTGGAASAQSRPRVSVAIVNWNTRDLLEQCLSSLAPDVRGGIAEVLVVDNGSRDDSVPAVEEGFPDVRLIRNDANLGFARAVNQAYGASTAEYFLMLNSDAIVTPNAIGACVEYLDSHRDTAAVGCRITYPGGAPQSSCFRYPNPLSVLLTSMYLSQAFPNSYLLNWDRYGHRVWDEPREVDCVMGGFMLLRRSAIQEGTLLDEGYFMYGEEADLCYRLRQAGWKIIFFPRAEIAHHHSGSTRDPHVTAWAYEAKQRAILRFIMKWRGTAVASLTSLIMLVGMIPRLMGWFVADLFTSLPADGTMRRTLKGRALRFQLSACVRPRLFDSSWEPEDRVSLDA
jgi:GT2 family glycosyltransferase